MNKASNSSSTESIISTFEKHLSDSINRKVSNNKVNGSAINLTKEEEAYIKRSLNDSTELKVETMSPPITLKKGATEICVPNAVDLVRRMESLYQKSETVGKIEIAKHSDTESYEYNDEAVINHIKQKANQLVEEIGKQKSEHKEFPIPHATNKNAYEIRSDILKMSLDFSKWKSEVILSIHTNPQEKAKWIPTENEVLETAKNFYKFVENKR